MNVLGIIPARGGSKGVPRKNIRELCGHPLLWYTAEAARQSLMLTHTILSTEDPEIAQYGRGIGLDIPFLRPANLAGDTTPTLPVLLHVVESMRGLDRHYDAICLLQPTNPLRIAEDIDECIRLLEKEGADTVLSVCPVPDRFNPHWVFLPDAHGDLRVCTGEREPIPRRQSLPPAFYRDGSVYVVRTSTLLGEHTLYGRRIRGYQIPIERCVNIDTPEDWAEAERSLKLRGQR